MVHNISVYFLAFVLTVACGGKDQGSNDPKETQKDSTVRAVVLRCELASRAITTAPFWETLSASVLNDSMTIPTDTDGKIENFGGVNPSWDSMLYCTTLQVRREQNSVRVVHVTKRVKNMSESPCSKIPQTEILSTQTEEFGLGYATWFSYRYYAPLGDSTTRRRVTYFATEGELDAGDANMPRRKCDELAKNMGSGSL